MAKTQGTGVFMPLNALDNKPVYELYSVRLFSFFCVGTGKKSTAKRPLVLGWIPCHEVKISPQLKVFSMKFVWVTVDVVVFSTNANCLATSYYLVEGRSSNADD